MVSATIYQQCFCYLMNYNYPYIKYIRGKFPAFCTYIFIKMFSVATILNHRENDHAMPPMLTNFIYINIIAMLF